MYKSDGPMPIGRETGTASEWLGPYAVDLRVKLDAGNDLAYM